MQERERPAALALLGFALALVVFRAARQGAPITWVDRAAVIVGFVLGFAAFVVCWSGLPGAGSRRRSDWWEATTALRGVPRRRRRAMIRALRRGDPPDEFLEPARRYAAVRAGDRPVWIPVAIALTQAASGGGRYDAAPPWLRLVLVMLAAVLAVAFLRSATRWRRIHDGLPVPAAP